MDQNRSDHMKTRYMPVKARQTKENAKQTGYVDLGLLCIVLILVGFGLVMLYSTSAYNGLIKFQDAAYYLKKQLFATILGVGVMMVVANIDYHFWNGLRFLRISFP